MGLVSSCDPEGIYGPQITQITSPEIKKWSSNNRLSQMSSKAVTFYSVPNCTKVNIQFYVKS